MMFVSDVCEGVFFFRLDGWECFSFLAHFKSELCRPCSRRMRRLIHVPINLTFSPATAARPNLPRRHIVERGEVESSLPGAGWSRGSILHMDGGCVGRAGFPLRHVVEAVGDEDQL